VAPATTVDPAEVVVEPRARKEKKTRAERPRPSAPSHPPREEPAPQLRAPTKDGDPLTTEDALAVLGLALSLGAGFLIVAQNGPTAAQSILSNVSRTPL
jgi:hypothetical protein